MSNVAARALIDDMAGRVEDGFKLFIAADFDVSGQSITHTLTNDTARYEFDNAITSHDRCELGSGAGIAWRGSVRAGRCERPEAAADRLRERGGWMTTLSTS